MKLGKNQEEWVQALESGEYKQTRDVLRDDNGFCCFGVLCEISKLAEWKFNDKSSNYDYLNNQLALPPEVRAWVGLSSNAGWYSQGKSLTKDNDDGKTFKEIASKIRKQPEEFFKEPK